MLNHHNLVKITLAPNPFSHQATLAVQGFTNNELHVEIMDVMGRVVQQSSSQSNQEIIIYRNQLNAGIYFYKLWAGEQVIGAGKFIIQ